MDLDDVVYVKLNGNEYDEEIIDEEHMALLWKILKPSYHIYNHFSELLRAKVRAFVDMNRSLEILKKTNRQFSQDCQVSVTDGNQHSGNHLRNVSEIRNNVNK